MAGTAFGARVCFTPQARMKAPRSNVELTVSA